MIRFIFLTTAATAVLMAQSYPRQASMVGGAGERGKCTVEVVVDGAAQVEVRGSSATLRTLSGRAAQWRRFECNSPLPENPRDFRFAGVDGRGHQELERDPRNGGIAVVRIEDRDGGAEGYTFDLFWDNNFGRPGGGAVNNGGRDRDDREGMYRPNYRDSDYYRRYQHGFGRDEAIRVCQTAISNQATRRLRSSDIHFERTAIDDQPGRQDWVMGSLDVHRRDGREERFRFSCSVDFESGRVRSAELEARPY